MGAGGSVNRSQSLTAVVPVGRRKLPESLTAVVPVNTRKLKIKGRRLEKMIKKMNDLKSKNREEIIEVGDGSLGTILEAAEDTDSDPEPSELDVQGEWYHPCYVPPPQNG